MSILLQRAAILIMRYSYVGIKWVDDFLGVKTNFGAELVDLLKNKPHTPPPQGMSDYTLDLDSCLWGLNFCRYNSRIYLL